MDNKRKTKKEVSEVFSIAPAGLGWRAIARKAREFREKHDFKHGDWVADHIAKIGGHIYFERVYPYGHMTFFRNYEPPDFKATNKKTKYKFYIGLTWGEGLHTLDINFHLAKLLSHYVLHNKRDKKIYVSWRVRLPDVQLYDEVHTEVMSFARDLTMPGGAFMHKWEACKRNLYEMSSYFKVPTSDIDRRLENINNISKKITCRYISD